jgi:ribose/xylose/arabinose/galactoside ABC-type transport system permease subunit
LFGGLVGVVNGVLISATKNHSPFLITLFTSFILRGATYAVARGKAVSAVDAPFLAFGNYWVTLAVVSAAVLVFYLVTHHSIFGLKLLGVGDEEDAAKSFGINPVSVRISAYTVSGFIAGIGCLLFSGKVQALTPLAGNGWEVEAIAACVIGGAVLTGGYGNVKDTLLGVLVVIMLKNVLNLKGLGTEINWIVFGTLLIFYYFKKGEFDHEKIRNFVPCRVARFVDRIVLSVRPKENQGQHDSDGHGQRVLDQHARRSNGQG